MTYKEFKTAILNASILFDCRCYLSVIDSPSVAFPHEYPLLTDDDGIWCPALKEFKGYTWDELEFLVDKGDWENWPEKDKTIMRIQDKQYMVTMYKVQSLDTMI